MQTYEKSRAEHDFVLKRTKSSKLVSFLCRDAVSWLFMTNFFQSSFFFRSLGLFFSLFIRYIIKRLNYRK